MKSHIFRILICFFNLFTACFAQTRVDPPIQSIQFFKNYALINPASLASDSSIQFNVGNKSLLGAFSGVRTIYAYGNAPIRAYDSYRPNHVIGLNFVNDKEGSYINRNRASILYSISIPVSHSVSMNAGIAAGFINYSYDASNIMAGGSVFAPNADIGLWLHGSNFNLGISGNQIIPSQLRPIYQVYTVVRYYNLIVDKTFNIDYNFSIKPVLLLRWQDKGPYSLDAGLVSLIHNNLSIALAYRNPQGVSASIGLEKVKLGQVNFRMLFSYYTPIGSNVYYNPPSYELSTNVHTYRNN